MALTIELPDARRLAFWVVLGQAGVTLLAALVCFAVAGSHAAFSALLGGGIGTAASFAMAVVAFGRRTPRSALLILAAFFAGELAKLILMIALFVAVWHWLHPSPGAMFAAYGATFIVYWIALAALLRPAFGRVRPLHGAQN